MPDSSPSPAEQEVLAVLEAWSRALHGKDLEALSRCYEPGVRVFDLNTGCEGFDELRALWEQCLPFFPRPIGTQRRDLRVEVGSDMALATFHSRLTGMDGDHPSTRSWLRTTVVLRQGPEGWRILHDHFSLPVDCENEKPVYLLEGEPEQESPSE